MKAFCLAENYSNYTISWKLLVSDQEMVIKEDQNLKFQQPYQQAMYYCSLILQDGTWPWMEQLEVLPLLDPEDLSKFFPIMLSKAFLECYIAGLFLLLLASFEYLFWEATASFWILTSLIALMFKIKTSGNIDRVEAESMIQHMEEVFFEGPNPISRPIFPSQHLTRRVIKLEKGACYFYPALGLNPNDENSALVHYIQVI